MALPSPADATSFARFMSPNVFYQYLKQYYPQLELTEAQKRDAAAMVRFRVLQKGEQLMLSAGSSCCYLLLSGKLKWVACGEGEQAIVKAFLYEGDAFGDFSLVNYRIDSEYVEALVNNVAIGYCASKDLNQLLRQHPPLALYIAINNGLLIKKQEKRYLPLFQKDAKVRLLLFLRYWARADGVWQEEAVTLDRYLTYQDIASYICTSRQTLHTLVKELEQTGNLHWGSKSITIFRSLWDE